MTFFKKNEIKTINSKTDLIITKAFTPKVKKKKVDTWFGIKTNRIDTNSSKDIINVRSQEKCIQNSDVAISVEKTILLHKNIDALLEKIENERLRTKIETPIKKHSQDSRILNDEITDNEENLINIKDKIETLKSENEIRSRLIEDLKLQVFERQVQLIEKTQILQRLQTELDTRNQMVKTINKEFKEKEQDLRILQEEINERDKIIQDIQEQLTEKQTWIIENNNFTEQLSRELEQNSRLIKKTKGELKNRKDELNSSKKELKEKKEKIDELHNENLLRNTIIETIEKQLEEQKITLIEKTKQIETLQTSIKERNEDTITQKQNLQQRLNAFHNEVEKRNQIIESIGKQLTEKQTTLIQYTNTTEKLQDELGQNKLLLQEILEKQEQKQQEITKKDNELFEQNLQLQKVCAELDMIRGEIDSRNQIIEDLEKQLAEEQTHLIEKTQLTEHLQRKLEQKQKKIEKQTDQLNLIQIQLEQKEQEIGDIKSELNERLNDLEFRNNEINGKAELINQLEKDFKASLQDLHEKNTQLFATKRELKEKDDELSQIRRDSEKKWIDFVLANIEIRDDREQIKGLNLKLEQREKLLQEAQCKFEKINQELALNREDLGIRLETLNKDLITRSKLLEELESQLTDRQILLIEKTQISEKSQDGEQLTRKWDDGERQEHINSLQTEIISRNRMIDTLSKQLTENQLNLLEKTSNMEQLCKKLEQQQCFVKETEIELVKENNELVSIRHDLEKKDNELHQLQIELEESRKELKIKQQNIADLLKQFQETFSRLKVTTITNEPIIKLVETQINEKESFSNMSKVDQSIIQNQKKSLAGDIDHIFTSRKEHLNQVFEDITWLEKLRICNEIEKNDDHFYEDQLKTKKIKDEEPT